MKIPLIREMVSAAQSAVDDLKKQINNVQIGPYVPGQDESITFDFKGEKWIGYLRGRNRFLVLTSNEENDKAIAVRTILDEDAKKL